MTTKSFPLFSMAVWCSLFFSLTLTNPAVAQTGCTSGAWVEVPGAGVTTGTGPAAVEFNGDLYLFVTGQQNDVFMNVFQAGAGMWSGWSIVSGGGLDTRSATRPAATVFNNRLYVFAIGVNDWVNYNVLSGTGWSGWLPTPIIGGTVGLAATTAWTPFGQEQLHLFARVFNRIYTSTLIGGAWAFPTEVPAGGLTTHGPAATSLGSPFVYVRGYDGLLYENIKDLLTGNWTGWHGVPGQALTTADPGVAASHGGIMVSIRGGESRIWQNLLPPGPGLWSQVPGNGRAAASAGPAVVVYQQLFLLFVSGPDDHILCSVATAGG
jgi:hypothetical protein